MAHGFSTTKTATGYKATIYRVTSDGTEILKTATFQTRAKATGFAKRWVVYYRRMAA